MPTDLSIDPSAVAALCRRHHIRRLSLFGSVLRDDFDPERSDIDILVEFDEHATKSLFTLIRIQDQLSAMLGREVDLTTPGSLSPYFRDEVIGAAEVMYDAA